jgi:hypothetical protein
MRARHHGAAHSSSTVCQQGPRRRMARLTRPRMANVDATPIGVALFCHDPRPCRTSAKHPRTSNFNQGPLNREFFPRRPDALDLAAGVRSMRRAAVYAARTTIQRREALRPRATLAGDVTRRIGQLRLLPGSWLLRTHASHLVRRRWLQPESRACRRYHPEAWQRSSFAGLTIQRLQCPKRMEAGVICYSKRQPLTVFPHAADNTQGWRQALPRDVRREAWVGTLRPFRKRFRSPWTSATNPTHRAQA